MRLRRVKDAAGMTVLGVLFFMVCQDRQNPFNQEENTAITFIDGKKPGDSVWNIDIDDTLKLSVAEKQLSYIDSVKIDFGGDSSITHRKDNHDYAWADTFTVDRLFDTSGERLIIGSAYYDGKIIAKDSIKINVIGIFLSMKAIPGGTINPSGSRKVENGASTAITATPDTGFHFIKWTRSGREAVVGDSTQSSTVVILTANATLTAVFAIDTFTLIDSSAGNGTVSPAGPSHMVYGAQISIAAAPSTGYRFGGWVRSGLSATIGDSTQNSTTVVLTGNATVTAGFSIETYTLTVTGAGNGTVSPSGSSVVNYGAQTPISATPSTHYHFVKWKRSGPAATITDSTNASTEVALTGDDTITAFFAINGCNLTVSSGGNGTVNPSGTTVENYGDVVPLVATPQIGYHFVKWIRSGPAASILDSTQALTTVVLTGGDTLLAVFAIDNYMLTISNGGNGSTSPSGGITVNYGDSTSIFATANAGYHFVQWTKTGPQAMIEDSTLASTSVVLTGNATVTAIFAINTYSLTIINGSNGSVTPYGSRSVNFGVSTAINATGNTGYHFVKWTRSGPEATITDSTQASTSVVLTTGSVAITATFTINTYVLAMGNNGGGTVDRPAGWGPVTYGVPTVIVATPDTGYHFVEWDRSGPEATITDSTKASTTVVLTGNATVTATFAINDNILTITTWGGGSVSPSGAFAVNYGTSTAISATPSANYHFLEWDRSGPEVTIGDSTQATTAAVLNSGSGTVYGLFALNSYSLTFITVGNGSTSPTGVVTLSYGATTLITATANTGYHFTGWTSSGPEAKISSPGSWMTTLVLKGNATVTATFAINTYTLNVASGGNGSVSPSGPSTVNFGDVTPITATADSGYSFIKWTRSGIAAMITDSTQVSTSVVLTGNATITAIFQ